MGHYRTRDVVSIPGLLSLVRVPLAAAFVLIPDPSTRLVILAASGISDLLDGWYARRFDCATPTGAALDPVTDKIFVATVVITLVLEGRMPWWAILVLSIRDIAELPLVLRFIMSARARRARADHPKANLGGKLATLVQFVVVGAALFGFEQMNVLLAIAGVVGAIAGIGYWRKFGSLPRPSPTTRG